MEMLRTVAKAWNIPDIRKKIIFTLLMLLIFRIGSQIPVPGIDREVLSQTFNSETGLFALFNLFVQIISDTCSVKDFVHFLTSNLCVKFVFNNLCDI